MDTISFFVYGSLKIDGERATYFDKFRVRYEKATIVDMDLYNLGNFPGIISGNGVVIGELHEYNNPDMVKKRMDLMEGYNGSDGSLFKRERRTVVTETGKSVEANVYIFNEDRVKIKTELTQIKNGVWSNK